MNTPATIPHDPNTGEVLDHEETAQGSGGLPALLGINHALAVSLAMAEVDQQITTAHAFPRSIDRAVKQIMTLATMDEETAMECIYALPRGNKPIKGPSIRFAEIVQASWGNNRVGARVTHVDRIEKYVEAEGVYHDLETNSATTARVRRRLSNSKGGLLTEDMIIVTGNAAAAIARRNAIIAGVPKSIWRGAYKQVERVIAGDSKTLGVRRDDALKAFAAFGVKPERVFAALELNGLADIGLEHMIVLSGMNAALKNGEATVEEMFPLPKAAGADVDKTDVKQRMAALAGNGNGKPADDKEKPADGKGKPAADKKAAGKAASKGKEDQASLDVGGSTPGEGGATRDSPPADGAALKSESEETTDPASSENGGNGDDPAPTAETSAGHTPPVQPADVAKQKAYAAGRQARTEKLTKKACPTEYRVDDNLLEAWMEGFDESPDDGD